MALVSGVVVLAALAAGAALLVRLLVNYLHFRKLELAIPGPPSLPLLGNALDFFTVTPDTVMQTVLRLVGGRTEMCRFSILNTLIVLVQDPDQLEELLLRRKDFNDKAKFMYNFLADGGGKKGLVLLGGAEWRAHRKWLAPGFNQKVLDRFVDIFSEEAKSYVERTPVNKEVDVLENLRKTVMRVFLRTSMTADGTQFDSELLTAAEFVDLFVRAVNNRSFNPLLWSNHVFLLTPLGRNTHRSKVAVESLCRRLIAEKREQLKNSESCDFERTRKTLMDIMLEDSDGSTAQHMGEDAVLDEFTTFLVANVETTVSVLCWTLKVLSMKPEVQGRMHAELDSVFGDSGRDVGVEDLPKLKYIDRVIKEVLRMFPPGVLTARQCYEETKLCGHTIPAGTTIALNIFGAHRDPKHWHKPEVFDPDRFLPENCKDRHPCAYIPFSIGPRNCIGGKYAMMNMTTFLATTLRAFELLPVDDHKDLQSLTDNMTFDLSSRLVGGVRVKFSPRRVMAA